MAGQPEDPVWRCTSCRAVVDRPLEAGLADDMVRAFCPHYGCPSRPKRAKKWKTVMTTRPLSGS